MKSKINFGDTMLKAASNLANSSFLIAVAMLFMISASPAAFAWTNPAIVPLGNASNFAVLSSTAISDVPTSNITGDIGVSPAAGTAITGFTCTGSVPTSVNGTIHVVSAGGSTTACQTVDPDYLTPTVLEYEAAYTNATGRASDADISTALDGLTYTHGVYTVTAANLDINNNNVTLNCEGDASGVFIFRTAGNLNVGTNASVNLIGGCQPGNIFWAVAGTTNILGGVGVESHFSGTILGGQGTTEITLGVGSTVNGRLMSDKTIALNQNTIILPSSTPPTTGPVFIDANLNGTLDSGEYFFQTIQAAVNNATSGDTIVVTNGTYAEDISIPASKTNLDIMGAGNSTTTIKGVSNVPVASSPLAVPNINVLANGTKLHGFTIEGPNYVSGKYSSGMVIGGSGVEIYNNAFRVTNSNAADFGEVSQGIQTYRDGNDGAGDLSGLNIHDNTFTSLGAGAYGYEGIFINHVPTDPTPSGFVTIKNNQFTGNIVRGITTERSKTIIQSNTVITDNLRVNTYQGINVKDYNTREQRDVGVILNTVSGFDKAMRIGAPTQVLLNISVLNNTLQLNNKGIHVLSATAVAVNNNNISGNTLNIQNDDVTALNATRNWWGTAAESGIIALISGNVSYAPWYIDAGMTSLNGPAPTLNHIGPRSVTQGTLLNFTITATSSSGQPLNFSLAGKPATANFTDNHNGTATFSWMPNSSDVSVHSVNFTVTDGIRSANETVAITVNALHAPITVPTNPAVNRLAVNLGTAGNFVILAKSAISTTGITSIVGDIGISPAAASYITGFGLVLNGTYATSSLVAGKVYAADYAPPTPINMGTAIGDMETAYTDAAGRTLPDATELGAGDISGMTLTPGLYKWSTGVLINSPGVTLDCQGNANAVYIFQIAQTLTVGNGAIITLGGGCQAQNIFWQVAGQATLGTTSVFNGNILDQTAIVLNTGATLNGRALAQTAVTLIANSVSLPAVAAPPATIHIAWKNAGAYNVTLNATGFNNTPIAYINYSLNNGSWQMITGGFGNVPINTSINNTLVFYAVDTSGNVETPNTIYTVIDNIDPVITSFTLSATSVNTGGTITGICTATDNFDPTPITAITGIDTSTAGTKTATCTATDSAGNNNATAFATYTVNTVPAVPTVSSGGGGGGFYLPAPTGSVASDSHMWDTLSAGSITTVSVNNPKIAVTQMSFNAINSLTKPRLQVHSLAGNPSAIAAAPKAYQYLQFTPTAISDSDISSVMIKFTVPNSWLAANSVKDSDIVLYRYSNSQWNALPTTKTGAEGSAQLGSTSYQATSPGFSWYAIGNKQIAATTTPAPTTPAPATPAPTPQPKQPAVTPPITGQVTAGQNNYTIPIIAVIIVLIVGYFGYKAMKKGKPQK